MHFDLVVLLQASTIVSTAGSIKYMGDDRQDTTMGGGGVDSDSSGFGTFGLIVFPGKKLDCIEKMGRFDTCNAVLGVGIGGRGVGGVSSGRSADRHPSVN